MVNVSTNDSKISINVTSAGTKGIVEAQNDKSKYYEELAHEHELNAKASELLAKDWANKLGDTVDGVEYSAKHYAEEAESTLTEVESAKAQAIADIQEQEGFSISALNVEKGSILVDLSNAKGEILSNISVEGVAQVNLVAGAGTTAISAVDAEANTQKQALVNVSNTEQTKLQGYVNQAQESATNAHNSEIYCKDVIERIGTAIKIKGRVNTFEDLPKSGNLDGDAYLVGLEGLSSYPEYYWFENHWEFLGTSGGGGAWGTITGDITTQTDLQNALDSKQPVGEYAKTNEANTFTQAQKIQTNATKGLELYSQASGGYLYVTRGGEIPVTMAIKSGVNGGTFGTTTNHQFQFRTNDKSRMVIGVDGSVKLEQNVADTSNDNQVATTKWTNIKLSSKQDSITDLATIRDGASKGATALQNVPDTYALKSYVDNHHDATKQDTLVSGTNIKTINGENVLGSGDLKLSTYHPPLLSCMWSDHLLNDIQWLRADTFSWQDGNVYETVYNTIEEEYSTGIEETEDGITFRRSVNGYKIADATQEQAILNKYNTTGIAWYYLRDGVNKRFKLPRTKWGFKGLRGDVGTNVEESLPNIKGTFKLAGQNINNSTFDGFSGAFYNQYPYTGNYQNPTGVSGTGGAMPAFDASRSSSTYKDGAPVQERATQMYLYFYVGEYAQTAIEQTAGLNTELFNGKVDLNASNISAEGKSLIDSWGKPSTRYTDFAIGATGTAYRAPVNGYARFTYRVANSNDVVGLSGSNIVSAVRASGANTLLHVTIPVRRGTTFMIEYSSTASATSANLLRFIHAEGEQ